MKTERDLFNGWLKHYEKHDVVIDQLQRAFMWQAWQASAQREGYKLVPLIPTKEMIEAGDDEQDDYWVLVDEFEAMIGAAE